MKIVAACRLKYQVCHLHYKLVDTFSEPFSFRRHSLQDQLDLFIQQYCVDPSKVNKYETVICENKFHYCTKKTFRYRY